MKKELSKLHLHMFDGEGAASADASASSGDEGGSARVEYGKKPNDSTNVQVGSGQETDQKEEEADPEAEFDALIKGKYKDQYSQRVQGVIQNRFKNSQNLEQEVGKWKGATALLFQRYGLKDGDIDGLEYAINHDEDLFSAEAEAEGLTVQKYMEMQRQQAEAAQARSMLAEMQKEKEKQDMIAGWEAEAKELQKIFPNFDIRAESQNEDFTQKLMSGYSVQDAFMTAHMADILNGSFDYAKQEAQTELVQNINKRQARPPENASKRTPAVSRKTDPSTWTDEDFDEVEKRVMAGEKIYL